jgi:hypothetical protein
VLDCCTVGAPRRSLAIACALVLAVVVPATAATRDLTVAVSQLTAPKKAHGGKTVSFGVRYVVRGPDRRRALATVVLVLTRGKNTYTVSSLPARVRPAIWKWDVKDTLPVLPPGTYGAVATVKLTRSGATISTARRTTSVMVS